MNKQKNRVFLVVLLALSFCALAFLFSCKQVEPAVPEAPEEIVVQSPAPAITELPQRTLSLAVPQDAKEGDLLIAQVCYAGDADTSVVPPSSDWVAILTSGKEGELHTASFYKPMLAETERDEPAVFTLSGGADADMQNAAAGKIMWVRGVDTQNPIYGNTDTTGDGKSLVANGTQTNDACVVVALFGFAGNGSGLAVAEGDKASRVLYNECAGGNIVLCALEQRLKAGAAGSLLANALDGGAWVSQWIALRLAPSGVVFRSGSHGTLSMHREQNVTVFARGNLKPAEIPSVNPDNGYAFTGWSAQGTARMNAAKLCELDLTPGLTLTAQYARREYTVKFVLGDHGKTKDQLEFTKLHYGDSIKVPNVITQIGWTFAGWDKTPATKVTADATYTAKYTQNVYTVRFVLGEHGSSSDTLVFTGLHDLDTIVVPNVTASAGWEFDGWDITPQTTVIGNATYTAQYTQSVYTVSFLVGTHGSSTDQLIWTGLHYGDKITIPSVTPNSGWAFDGWSTTPVTTVIASASYTAQYSATTYTVTFDLGEHGSSEDTLVFSGLNDGDTITVPLVYPDEGWEFGGWDAEPETSVFGSATYHAIYTAIPYTVVFDLGAHGHSSDQLVFENVHYGDTITIPSFTLDTGYNLLGWNVTPSTTVTGDAYYILLYLAPPVK